VDPENSDEEPERPSLKLAETFRNKVDALSKLTQLEAALEGSFFRTLHELKRIQVERKRGKSASG